jgi:hypothetical protein
MKSKQGVGFEIGEAQKSPTKPPKLSPTLANLPIQFPRLWPPKGGE